MGVYTSVDLESTDDGDLVLDDRGDFKIASPIRTMAQAIMNAVLTNKGDILSDPLWGSNLETFIGERNTISTRNFMEMNIVEAIREQGLAIPSDVEVDVIATDIDDVGILVTVKGSFFNTDTDNDTFGQFIQHDQGITLAFNYPFQDGLITRVSET